MGNPKSPFKNLGQFPHTFFPLSCISISYPSSLHRSLARPVSSHKQYQQPCLSRTTTSLLRPLLTPSTPPSVPATPTAPTPSSKATACTPSSSRTQAARRLAGTSTSRRQVLSVPGLAPSLMSH